MLDTCVRLFVDKGHVDTSASYYHVRSKEELADAIIAKARPRAFELVVAHQLQSDAKGGDDAAAYQRLASNWHVTPRAADGRRAGARGV